MTAYRDSDRLSGGDALFLHLEREGMPLNVASVNVFEGVISLDACTAFIESKLPLIPRYRQRVVAPPFGFGSPTWEYEPNFDLSNHVHQVTLRRGTDAELKAVAGKILSTVMNRQHPLWDFTLVQGLKGGRTGVVTRMHHCMADGLAGVALLNVLMDASPEVHPLPKRKLRIPKPSRQDTPSLILDGVITSSLSVAQRFLTAQREVLEVCQQVLSTGHQNGQADVHKQTANPDLSLPSVDELSLLMPEVTTATQPLPFNTICRGPQKFRWAEIPLADIKAIKEACGATVNEVALTIITLAFQRYSELRNVDVRGRLLRIVVPVNVRGNGHASDLGNRITFIPVTLPLDIRSPRKLIAAIHKRTAFLKSAHIAECVSLFGTMLGTIPTAAQQLIGPIISQVPLGLCNIIFTNVPGPTSPLYLLGHKMLRCYPYVPIGGDLGINCAMLTYNGTAYFGFTGDIHAAPDLGRLEKFLMASFTDLRRAAGIHSQRRNGTRAHVKPGLSTVAGPQSVILIPAKPDPGPVTVKPQRAEPPTQGVA